MEYESIEVKIANGENVNTGGDFGFNTEVNVIMGCKGTFTKEKSKKPVCFSCKEVVRYCDQCYKDLEIGDKIICDDFNDYGRHYCSKKCYREAYEKDYTLIVEMEK